MPPARRPHNRQALRPPPSPAPRPRAAHLPGHPAEPYDAQFEVCHGQACARPPAPLPREARDRGGAAARLASRASGPRSVRAAGRDEAGPDSGRRRLAPAGPATRRRCRRAHHRERSRGRGATRTHPLPPPHGQWRGAPCTGRRAPPRRDQWEAGEYAGALRSGASAGEGRGWGRRLRGRQALRQFRGKLCAGVGAAGSASRADRQTPILRAAPGPGRTPRNVPRGPEGLAAAPHKRFGVRRAAGGGAEGTPELRGRRGVGTGAASACRT